MKERRKGLSPNDELLNYDSTVNVYKIIGILKFNINH